MKNLWATKSCPPSYPTMERVPRIRCGMQSLRTRHRLQVWRLQSRARLVASLAGPKTVRGYSCSTARSSSTSYCAASHRRCYPRLRGWKSANHPPWLVVAFIFHNFLRCHLIVDLRFFQAVSNMIAIGTTHGVILIFGIYSSFYQPISWLRLSSMFLAWQSTLLKNS